MILGGVVVFGTGVVVGGEGVVGFVVGGFVVGPAPGVKAEYKSLVVVGFVVGPSEGMTAETVLIP